MVMTHLSWYFFSWRGRGRWEWTDWVWQCCAQATYS